MTDAGVAIAPALWRECCTSPQLPAFLGRRDDRWWHLPGAPRSHRDPHPDGLSTC
jgi:hypothetical protein